MDGVKLLALATFVVLMLIVDSNHKCDKTLREYQQPIDTADRRFMSPHSIPDPLQSYYENATDNVRQDRDR